MERNSTELHGVPNGALPRGLQRDIASPAHNLATPLTPLLGRERELEAVHTYLLSEDTRLVTLTGPGGSGKTRLALEAARQLVAAFRDGVWFVDLSPVREPDLILSTIAQTLDMHVPDRRSLREVLVDSLRDRQLLLVLDNCEHLLASLREVGSLLEACPDVTVLATSRATLHLAGEQLLSVHPLRTPDLSQQASAELARHYAAVALFVQRASALDSAFQLTDANARAVAEICVRLDGLPLAIELAAAWIRVLTPEQIAARLDDRFHLLAAGPGTATPRQKSLRATVDWSYSLLSEPERALLRRLSVFAGGWTLEAADFIGLADGVQPEGVLNSLAQLVDQSLVIVEAQRSAARYRLHESIRQYALERLEEAGEADRTRDRHLAFYLSLAEEAELKLRGPECQVFLHRLEEEHANLRMALEWALVTPQRGDAALRLSGALTWFWWLRSYLDEGRHWLHRSLNEVSGSPKSRMKALYGEGILAHFQRDVPTACRRLEESLVLAREQRDHWTEAWVLHHMGRLAYYENDAEKARSLGQKSLSVATQLGDDWLIAWALHLLGLAAYIAADYTQAREHYERSLAIRRRLEYQEGIGILLHLLGLVALQERHLDRARALLREGLEAARGLQGPAGMAMPLAAFAGLAAGLGEPLRAVRLSGAVSSILESYHAPLVPLFEPILDEALEVSRGVLDDANYAAAWAEGRTMQMEESIAEALAVGAETPIPAQRPRNYGPFAELTPTELKVLRLLSRGLTTKEIAAELVVSVSTVDRHLTHVYSKLAVRNRAEATALAVKANLA